MTTRLVFTGQMFKDSTRRSSAATPVTVECHSLLAKSLAISSELGMRPLMERVLSWPEILGV